MVRTLRITPEKMAHLRDYARKMAWLRVTRCSLITHYARKKAKQRITPEKRPNYALRQSITPLPRPPRLF